MAGYWGDIAGDIGWPVGWESCFVLYAWVVCAWQPVLDRAIIFVWKEGEDYATGY